MRPLTPHFNLPFRFDPIIEGMAAVEQDSLDDVVNCCEVIVRYHPGQRYLVPEFGISDLTFEEIPINTSLIGLPIAQWEPRADAAFEESTDPSDELIQRITIMISKSGRIEPS